MEKSSKQYHIDPEVLVLKVETWKRGEGNPRKEIEEIFGVWIKGRIEKKAENKDTKRVVAKVYDLALDEIVMTIHKLRAPEAFVSWAMTVIDHQVTAYFRQQRREEKIYAAYVNEYIVTHSATNQGTGVAEEWLSQLKPKHARVLRLHVIKEIPVKEIAVLEGIPEGTVKSRLYYARKALEKVVPKK